MLTWTVNLIGDPADLGLHARHGMQRHERLADAKVMSVRDMRDFIRGLMVKWLESK